MVLMHVPRVVLNLSRTIIPFMNFSSPLNPNVKCLLSTNSIGPVDIFRKKNFSFEEFFSKNLLPPC